MTFFETVLHRIAAGFAMLRSAAAASAAVESGDRPAVVDLQMLGIDPRAFASIGHG